MLSPAGLAFIKRWEKLCLAAYLDLAGVPTIGYGSTRYLDGRPVQMGDEIDEHDADVLLLAECSGINRRLNVLVTAPLSQGQRDALISFCYNLGVQAFAGSTLRRLINEGAETGPINMQFLCWNKAHLDGKLVAIKGLTNRRRAEAAMFATKEEAAA